MNPESVRLYNEGKKLFDKGNIREAIRACTRILEIDFTNIDARSALISSYGLVNDLPLLVGILRDTAEVHPNFLPFTSAYLFCLNYFNTSRDAVFKEHRRMMERVERHILNPKKPNKTSISGRKIRIGYVSGDFREHSCAYLTEPLLRNHDRTRFEIFLYSNNPDDDAKTEMFKTLGNWRAIRHIRDEEAAHLIRNDGIDILVDLSGHTVAGRISVFFHRPAPVQISWYGYLNTIGTVAIDYRITDPLLAPEGGEQWYTEKLIRLKRSFLYQPPHTIPEIAGAPYVKNGFVTFASLHNIKKINTLTIDLWCAILRQVPNSRIIVTCEASGEPQEILIRRFASRGVAPERVTVIKDKPINEFFYLFHSIDLILDTFPYTSGVSAMHGIWMGVPTLTIEGDTELWRNCSAVNRSRGIPEYITRTPEEFVATATALGHNPEQLLLFRKNARTKPVVDNASVVQDIEQTYSSFLS